MCDVTVIPFSLVVKVPCPVLYHGLKVIRLSSANYSVRHDLKNIFLYV